jgi:hypothetical protein
LKSCNITASIVTYSVGINDVDDDTKFADISAVVDQGNSADLNKTSERRALNIKNKINININAAHKYY